MTIEKIDKEKKKIMSHIHIPSVKCECCRNTIDALLLIDDLLSSLNQIRQETLEEVRYLIETKTNGMVYEKIINLIQDKKIVKHTCEIESNMTPAHCRVCKKDMI